MKAFLALLVSFAVAAAKSFSVPVFSFKRNSRSWNTVNGHADDSIWLDFQDDTLNVDFTHIGTAAFPEASFVDKQNGKTHAAGLEMVFHEAHKTAETKDTRSSAKEPMTTTTPLVPTPRLGMSLQKDSKSNELASVVKIFVNTVRADFVSPWQVMAPSELSGSGFIVKEQMIMTNAHLVADQTRVLVRKHGNPKKFISSVVAVCHDCDLALLTVEDEAFWEGLKPLAFGGIPQLQDTVAVLGYPTGGDQLSITEGVVSRVGVSKYAHSSFGLLTVQIDAAINPGNSGGPAVSGGKVVGVAFQGFSQMQNVGYIVPYPVIRHFLNDIALHKRHTGFVSIGIKIQTMENEALKRLKGMDAIPPDALPENVTPAGILVLAVDEVRSTLYFRGKIYLPISRYQPLPSQIAVGELCVLDTSQGLSASAKKKSEPCKLKEATNLLDDKPAAPLGDTSSKLRQVKEVAERVIWQPEDWKPSIESRPETSCGSCLRLSEARHPTIKPHGVLSIPEDAVQYNKTSDNSGNEKATGEQKRQPTPHFDFSSATDGNVKRAVSSTSQVESPSSDSHGSVDAFIKAARQGKDSPVNPSALQPTPPKRRVSTAQASMETLLAKLIGEKAETHRAASAANSSFQGITNKKNMSSQLLFGKRQLRVAGSRSDYLRGGVVVSTSTASAEYRDGNSVQPVTVREHETIKNNAELDSAAFEKAGKAASVKALNAPRAVSAKAEDGQRASAGHEVPTDAALASAIHPTTNNPYFNPNLVNDSEFFGLREGDVILSLENYDIADDGTVAFRGLERVSFTYVLTHFFNGETTWAYVLRNGRIIKVTVPLMAPTFKVPLFTWDTKPSYFVYGGFVFTPLSKEIMFRRLRLVIPHKFEYLVQRLDYQEQEGDEFVILSLILASDISVGYEQAPCIVHSVNGQGVRSMRDLVRLIEGATGEFVKLSVELNGSGSANIVIDRKKADTIRQKVLRDHNIVGDRSTDLTG